MTAMRSRCPLSRWLVVLLILAGCGGSGGSSDDDAVAPTATVVATPIATATPSAVAAGALDPGFGTDGLVMVSMQGYVWVTRHGFRVLADGATELLVEESSSTEPVPRPVIHLVRISADGRDVDTELVGAAIDPEAAAFDATGAVWIAGTFDGLRSVTRVPRGSDGTNDLHTSLALTSVSDLVPVPDGGVLVVGATATASALERYTADGRIDAAFGVDGIARGPARRGDVSIVFGAAAVGTDGRIFVTGTRYEGFGFSPIVFAYTASGKPDASFGRGGLVVFPSSGNAGSVLATADGGAVISTTDDVQRLDATGTHDAEWSARAANVAGGPAALGARGDLATVGMTFVPDEPPRHDCFASSGGVCQREAWLVSRLLPDGSPDVRFGGTGTVVTDTPPPNGAQDTGFGRAALAPAGRITVAGIACRAPFVCDVAVARYGDVE